MNPFFIAIILGVPALLFCAAIFLMVRRALIPNGAEVRGVTDQDGLIINRYIWLFCSMLFGGIGVFFTYYAWHHPSGRMLGYGLSLTSYGFLSFFAFLHFKKAKGHNRA